MLIAFSENEKASVLDDLAVQHNSADFSRSLPAQYGCQKSLTHQQQYVEACTPACFFLNSIILELCRSFVLLFILERPFAGSKCCQELPHQTTFWDPDPGEITAFINAVQKECNLSNELV